MILQLQSSYAAKDMWYMDTTPLNIKHTLQPKLAASQPHTNLASEEKDLSSSRMYHVVHLTNISMVTVAVT